MGRVTSVRPERIITEPGATIPVLVRPITAIFSATATGCGPDPKRRSRPLFLAVGLYVKCIDISAKLLRFRLLKTFVVLHIQILISTRVAIGIHLLCATGRRDLGSCLGPFAFWSFAHIYRNLPGIRVRKAHVVLHIRIVIPTGAGIGISLFSRWLDVPARPWSPAARIG
jgi:hypothetical protein